MKRNFGMWMAIICILVVGVSVTKMTQDFVVSQGVDAAAIVGVMDTTELSLTGTSMKQALENHIAIPAEPAAGAAQAVQETVSADTPAEAAPQEPAALTAGPGANHGPQDGAVWEYVAVTSEKAMAEEEVAVEEGAVADSEADAGAGANLSGLIAEHGTNSDSEDADSILSSEDAAQALSKQEQISSTPKSPLEPAEDGEHTAIQETVKSPLNPVVNEKQVNIVPEAAVIQYTAETFLERFVDIEESVEAIWQNVTTDNHTANLAAAEQERLIWDSELNFIYSTIRSKMTVSETENLKILEVEWLKERDLYAEKMAAKSPMKNAQTQNPAYVKALAQKTKERCYWLVSEYDEVLNRDEKPVEMDNEAILESGSSKSGKDSGKKVSPQTKK